MRAYISLAREMPEGAYRRALKAEAEVVEGGLSELLWDLAVCRYAYAGAPGSPLSAPTVNDEA